MSTSSCSLQDLGWLPFFQQQLTLDEWENAIPARVTDYQRTQFSLITADGALSLAITSSTPALTVGDWLLLDSSQRLIRVLERSSLFARQAAGPESETQLLAANVDTAFLVSSMNRDFKLSRLERYLALVYEAGADAVVVLTKRDLCDDPEDYLQQAQSLGPRVPVLTVNGLASADVETLKPWCGKGRTVVLLGSSGVGKSTLVNTLTGTHSQSTQAIREQDARGRHTTTARALIRIPDGGWLIDTPGLRELKLSLDQHGLALAFDDIATLSRACKFKDCGHHSEPGCAVLAAVAGGELDERRLANYHKLTREQAALSASLAERRAHDRKLGRLYRSGKDAQKLKRGDS